MAFPYTPAVQDPSSAAPDKPFSAQAHASVGIGKVKPAGQKRTLGEASRLIRFCDFVIRWSIYLAVFLIPLWFLPFTQDALEINKQTLLVILSVIALLAWFGRMMALRQVEFKRTVLNLIVALYVLGYGIVAWFSSDRYLSFVGTGTLEQFSFLSVLAFAVMYFVISNNVRDLKFVRNILYTLAGALTLTSFFGILQMLGAYILPWDFARVVTFNTIGTIYALGIFQVIGLLVINALILVMSGGGAVFCPAGRCGIASKVLLIIAAVLNLIGLILLDFWIVWVLLIVGSIIVLAFAIVRAGEFRPGAPFMLPMLTLVIAVLLLIVNLPLGINLPAEISPSTGASFEIAKSALQESPLVGSGPGTFGYDYTKFHSSAVNATIFWNVIFDRANSHALTLLATTGLIGLMLWLVLIAVAAVRAIINLFRDNRAEIWRYILVIGSVFITVIVSRFLYSSNFVGEFIFWLFLGLVGALISREWFRADFKISPRAALTMSFVFIILIVGSVSLIYLACQRYAAEVIFVQAIKLDQNRGSIDDVITKLNSAVRLNRYEDTYLRNLSSAVTAKFANEVSGQVPQEKATYVQSLINDMVSIAKAAADLNPANSANWANLGATYRSLVPYVQGSGDAAKVAEEKVVELAPTNPVSYIDLAMTHIAVADLNLALTQSEDEKIAAEAKTIVTENLARAEELLNKAIELKQDYAPAHYQLALVYDRQGKLAEAIVKMEQVAAANTDDVGVAFQLGMLYLRNNDNDKARNALEYAVKLVPSYSNARWFLATVYENLKDIPKAIEQVEKVLELNPDNATIKQRLDNLKQYGTSQPPSIPEPVKEGTAAPQR
ncbi:MAG: tetratricopeptide repeat protein [Patescibacteria group bacterium]|nr:tetratricopeptide repeat protein [Patescibacteria group bacterium]